MEFNYLILIQKLCKLYFHASFIEVWSLPLQHSREEVGRGVWSLSPSYRNNTLWPTTKKQDVWDSSSLILDFSVKTYDLLGTCRTMTWPHIRCLSLHKRLIILSQPPSLVSLPSPLLCVNRSLCCQQRSMVPLWKYRPLCLPTSLSSWGGLGKKHHLHRDKESNL